MNEETGIERSFQGKRLLHFKVYQFIEKRNTYNPHSSKLVL